jgi:hypothetical protein
LSGKRIDASSIELLPSRYPERNIFVKPIVAPINPGDQGGEVAHLEEANEADQRAACYTSSGVMGHVVNARVGRLGLYYIDNQPALGAYRPFFRLESSARNVHVFTAYNPQW